MKKLWTLIMALMLALSLAACGETEPTLPPEYTFPDGTAVLGVDVAGLNKEAAWSKLEAAAGSYTLELTVDGVTVSVTAQDIGLSCSKDAFMAGADAMELGTDADFSGVVSFNEGKLRALMRAHFNKDVTEAAIEFDEASGQYVLVPHADGQKSNPNELVDALREPIRTLTPAHSLTEVSEILHPVRSSDMPEVQEALAQANKMIGVQLSYTFNPEGTSTTHDIPAEVIRSFVALGEDGLTPIIQRDALDAYVTELSDQYSIEGSSGAFQTTGGGSVGLTVTYNGVYVDVESLAEDIAACIQEGISETRSAPYFASGNRDMAYGGTYIEINLSSQHLWFYKNGERLVSTSLVSGKVAEEWCTPTGIYSIYAKSSNTYLEGEDYRTFVNYWMPFYYGYGLHDATWRSSFGGDIYLYEGSHGCVNLPLSAASTIYSNAPVGTKVILYGGERSVPPLTQKLSGTTSYDVADDSGSFKLKIKVKYSDPKISYSSDNPSVASVDSSGNVTVNGIGTANITVSVPEHSYYTAAETTVTVTVHSACDEGRHVMGTPTTVTAPTCQPGLQRTSCTKCSHFTEQSVEAVAAHTYGEWVTIKAPTCSEEGTQERTCTVCKSVKETGSIPATGNHTESDWVTTLEPTCVKEGTKATKCTVCGTAMNTAAISATGVHTAGDWETVTAATCTAAGTKVKKCTQCGTQMETATIDPGHKPGDWETVTAATCTAEGAKVKKCTVCGAALETAAIGKKDHTFDSGPSCTVCGAENPSYVPPTTAAPATDPTTAPATDPAAQQTPGE